MSCKHAHWDASSSSISQAGAAPATRQELTSVGSAAGPPHSNAAWLSPASTEQLGAATEAVRLAKRCGVCGGLGSGGVAGGLPQYCAASCWAEGREC